MFNVVFSLIPTALMPLSVLSYASILGLISTLSIIAVILIDGFSKPDSPGSLWSPADTSLGVASLEKLGLSFGLFMAGVSARLLIHQHSLVDHSNLVLRSCRDPIIGSGHDRSVSVRHHDRLGVHHSHCYLRRYRCRRLHHVRQLCQRRSKS